MRSDGFAHAAIGAALALVVATQTPSTRAAGLYFSDRGVRPVGRGGAFVAGADDLGSIWYNPAGVAFAGKAVLVDASWLRFRSTYQRRSIVRDPATGDEAIQGSNYYPEVEGTSPLLPLPTIAISNNFDSTHFNLAFGMMAPYAALTSYPEGDLPWRGASVPPPQRYSLITLDGSALVVLGLYGSYKPSEKFAIGAGLQMLTGNFATRLALNACPPDRFLCAQEDPRWDAYTQLTVGPIFAPSANIGFIGVAHDAPGAEVRIGGSFQLPYWLNGPATAKIRLPSAAMFRDAHVEGERARVSFRLPAIARLGIETRLGEKKQTRIELAVFYEAWSMHDRITISPAGDGIRMRGVTGLPDPYEIGELAQARGFRDTFSVHLGLEHGFEAGGHPLAVRAGASYERSAVPPSYLSVLTIDLDKIQLAAGSSLYVGDKRNIRLDAVLGYAFGMTTDVDPGEAKITKVKVVRANAPAVEDQTKINGGRYTAGALLLGIGLNWKY